MTTKKTTKKVTKKVVKKKPAVKKTVTKKPSKKTTKKVTKKSVKKKPAVKKATKKSTTLKKNLVIAPEEKAFWVMTGEIIRDIVELNNLLASIEDEVFNYHADDTKHDFATWVELVLCDEDCANELRLCGGDLHKNKKVVNRYSKYYM